MCEHCLRSRTELSLIPDRLQQSRCSKCNPPSREGVERCGPIRNSRQRVRENLVILQDAEDVDVSLSVEPIDDRTTRIHIHVSANYQRLPFEDTHETLLQTSDVVCQTCSRKDGSYFEAEFQIRSTGRRLDSRELASIRATLDEMILDSADDPMFFVTNEGPVQGGWDLQLGSKSSGEDVVQETHQPLWRHIEGNLHSHRREGWCRGHKANIVLQEARIFNRGCDEAP